jgi:hypothetical protein
MWNRQRLAIWATKSDLKELCNGNWCLIGVMRARWRFILPVVALIAFGAESSSSLRMNRSLGTTPRRYYWWSSIRLDTDPLNKNPKASSPCKSGEEDCGWEPRGFISVDPGYLTKSLMLLALPAFAVGAISVSGLRHLGITKYGVSCC